MLPLIFPLLLASAVASPHSAYGPADCRIGTLLPAPDDAAVTWSGGCKDGFAAGPGVLAWNDRGDSKRRIEGTLVRGNVAGEATLTWDQDPGKSDKGAPRHSYIGTLRDGQPDGQGFFRYGDGDRYEGEVANGKPSGTGIYVRHDRGRYEGQWADGKREGYGKETFALGGSYDGAWKNDRFEGAGTVVFAGTPARTWQGQFVKGIPAGAPPAGRTSWDTFTAYGDQPGLGSKMRGAIGTSFVPPQATWSQLTVEQQNLFKTFYRTLAPGDEPPYPSRGIRGTLDMFGQISRNFRAYRGRVSVLVLVGADGKARSVSLLDKVPLDFSHYVSAAVLRETYKPAVCAGQPCEMLYPVNFNFD